MTTPWHTTTITTTRTEEEANGWCWIDGEDLGCPSRWFHQDASHEDQWPDLIDLRGGVVGSTLVQPNGVAGFETLLEYHTYQCSACPAVLVQIDPYQFTTERETS